MTDLRQQAAEFWRQQPHPLNPELSIGDFATAVRLATKTKFGGHASPHEAGLFWKEFQGLGMAPQDYEHLLERVAPVSFAYHGRPPSMQELALFRDKQPHEVNKYYGDLPDKHYPHLTAAQMVGALHAADPHAREHVGRKATKNEAVYLHYARENPGDYYRRLAADSDQKSSASDTIRPLRGLQDGGGGNPPGRGMETARRPAVGQ
jgi:hypothetical protein